MWLLLAVPVLAQTEPIPADSSGLITIGSISIEGNYQTRTNILLREMALHEGDTLRLFQLPERLEIDRRKIINTNLFITAAMQLIPDDDDPAVLNVRVVVKERWYFLAMPVFQIADRNFNEWWYERNRDLRRTTYGLYISYANVTGRADRLRVLAEFGFIPKYEIAYSIPYIDKAMKIGVSTGISYTTNKTTVFRTWNDKLDYFNSENLNRERFYTYVNFIRRNKFYTFHSLDLRWNSTQLSDTLSRLNPNYLLRAQNQQNYFQLTYSFSYDRRDNVQYPLRGRQYFVQASKQGLLPSDDLNQAYLYGGYRQFFPLGGRWYASSGARMRLSAPRRQPYLQTSGLGYRSDLVRGYELYVIDGQHYGLWQNEVKYRLFNVQKTFDWIPIRQFNTIPLAAYLTAYADAGYVRNYYPEFSNTRLGNTVLYGAGTGLDFVTFYNMVFRLNYTLNGLGEHRFFFNLAREF
ncbi:hypothetical protein GCM10027275_24470 [Rhabdobacter roseus]